MPVEISNKTKTKIKKALVASVAKAFLTAHRKSGFEIEIIFIGDIRMRTINRNYRHKDSVTDVLSFTESDSGFVQMNFLGQIFIDYQQIKRQAKQFEHSVDKELIFILVHGLLHLLGYDDKTEGEAQVMEDLGNKFIKKLKI